MLNYGNLLRTTKRSDEAKKTYLKVLETDAGNGAALESLGYLSRESGDPKAASEYFEKLIRADPNDYVPYLAIGDLSVDVGDFSRAQTNYEKAYKLAPDNSLIVARAMNAALEAHQLPDAKKWLDRANEEQRSNPEVMREHERYLTLTGNYQESAKLGYAVIEKLPRDPEAPVYLAYELLFLNRYDDAMAIVRRFEPLLPKDKDLPLIAGYVYAHNGQHQEAVKAFTRALERDPQMATGYMNRGYVWNDLRMATRAEQDFRKALALRPDYGEAHLGLAYSLLQLRRPQGALKETELAEKTLGESGSLHLARAEAYRQRANLGRAEGEYQRALKLQNGDENIYLALADTQYRLGEYQASADTLNQALTVSPNSPLIEAQLARSYAKLGRSQDANAAIARAEKVGGDNYRTLLATADALQAMGERDQAMERYRALSNCRTRIVCMSGWPWRDSSLKNGSWPTRSSRSHWHLRRPGLQIPKSSQPRTTSKQPIFSCLSSSFRWRNACLRVRKRWERMMSPWPLEWRTPPWRWARRATPRRCWRAFAWKTLMARRSRTTLIWSPAAMSIDNRAIATMPCPRLRRRTPLSQTIPPPGMLSLNCQRRKGGSSQKI